MTTVTYEYTTLDRLKTPHSYMYTPYLGKNFLQAYVDNRSKNIRRFTSKKSNSNVKKIDEYFNSKITLILEGNEVSLSNTINVNVENFSSLIKKTEISTSKLLESLLHMQLSNGIGKDIKSWLDFLVQRFEVTKKIYENYHLNGFRSGKGDNEIVRLYWLFSLLLTLVYSETKNIKYLSTLLKVNDLLCSLNDNDHANLPIGGYELVLLKEVQSIKELEDRMERYF